MIFNKSITQFNNTARNSLARLNANGSLDLTYTSQTDGVIRNISPYPENRVLIGGFSETSTALRGQASPAWNLRKFNVNEVIVMEFSVQSREQCR